MTHTGDWYCVNCGDHQFASRIVCRKCSAPRPAEDGENGGYGDANGGLVLDDGSGSGDDDHGSGASGRGSAESADRPTRLDIQALFSHEGFVNFYHANANIISSVWNYLKFNFTLLLGWLLNTLWYAHTTHTHTPHTRHTTRHARTHRTHGGTHARATYWARV